MKINMFRLMTALFALCQLPLFGQNPPASAEELREKLESAIKAKDTDAIKILFNQEDMSQEPQAHWMEQAYVSAEIMALINTNVSNVSLAPLPSGFQAIITNAQVGVLQKFNVTPIGLINVGTSPQNLLGQLLYGKKGNFFYLAVMTHERIPHSNPLSVQVSAGPNVDALTYTGRWVYVKDGQEFSVEISDKTNRFKPCFGDYIKSCEIRRTSTNETPGFATWFYFDVNEGGTNVFESPELTNEDLFVYRRK